MKARLRCTVALLLLAASAAARADATRAVEMQKIESLISTVENLKDATFIRNGTEYDCKAAAKHMRTKWEFAGDRVKTARQFIRDLASSSSETGQPYLIRFKDGREIKSGDFLSAELDKLESPSSQPTSRPATSRMSFLTWYSSLEKPEWTPSPGKISLIWTILYPIIAISFGFVFYQVIRRRLPGHVAMPFVANFAANALFMPLFAGLHNLPLAAADIVIVLATIVWMVLAIWPHYRWVAVAQIPYLAWVGVATGLQIAITALNR